MNEPSFPDLRAFLDQLRRDGDLVVVEAEVDPRLEVAEIHRRVIAAGGPGAPLHARPRRRLPARHEPLRHRAPRRARLRPAAGPARPAARRARRDAPAADRRQALGRARPRRARRCASGSRRRRSGPVTEVVTGDVRLDRLPALTCWPEDGGPFVTLPLVYTEHPDAPGPPNLGMYRMQVHDARTTGMHWQIGKGGGFHHARRRGARREPAGHRLPRRPAGAHPRRDRAAARERARAAARLAPRRPRLGAARARARTRSSRAPSSRSSATCRPGVRRPEGPFGDHYGYYSLRHDYPVFEVERLCRRRDAIFPATVVGKPRQEDFFIGDLLQELLSPLFPLVMPGVVDLWSYGETGYHSLAAAVVQERYRREAMASAFRILGEGQLSLTKFLLVTDRPVDLRDFRATLEHVLARTRPETDLFVFSNLSMDTLDYTGPTVNEGSKGVWLGLGDPVRELPREFRPRRRPRPRSRTCASSAAAASSSAARRAADDPGAGPRLAAHPAFRGLAAPRAHRRAGARRREPHELPLDDVHPLRAGGRPPRGVDARRPQPRRPRAAGPDRRADEALVPERALVRPRDRRPGHAPLEGVLPRRPRRDGRLGARPPRPAVGGVTPRAARSRSSRPASSVPGAPAPSVARGAGVG